MMRIGSMRQCVELQRAVNTQDGYGQVGAVTWVRVAATRASVKPLNGRELFWASQVHAQVSHEVMIRYIEGVTTKMRILYDERVLNILSAVDVDERHRWLKLMCVEAV